MIVLFSFESKSKANIDEACRDYLDSVDFKLEHEQDCVPAASDD